MAGETDDYATDARTVVGLGELIWDMFPEGRSMGGAPSNFAYQSRLLGNRSVVASRVGDDELGREALGVLGRAGVEAGYVQVDSKHPTGTVEVEIGERGEPRFTVNPNSAWDYLELSPRLAELARQADAVCFGTLGQRHPRARGTILSFVGLTPPGALRLFDVNLRHSFFSADMLVKSLELASIVKFNSDELSVAAGMLGLHASSEEELSRRLIAQYDLDLVAITRGEKGSLLLTEGRRVEHLGQRVKVADTIGCGDAFAAALAHCLLRGLSLETASEAANRLGAWVATQSGATPRATPQMIEEILGGL
ncbi:MAG TPA: carbohydrate kinase [Pyrinomonadaceae bacterium]|nr:carbohydrate kinase [Pyrinomonadaceae bacterium]